MRISSFVLLRAECQTITLYLMLQGEIAAMSLM